MVVRDVSQCLDITSLFSTKLVVRVKFGTHLCSRLEQQQRPEMKPKKLIQQLGRLSVMWEQQNILQGADFVSFTIHVYLVLK